MRITKIKKAAKIIFPVAMTLLTLSACDTRSPNKHENDKTIITSCNNLRRASVSTLTSQEQIEICEIMMTDLKRSPPSYLLHDFLRLVALVKGTATDESANSIAMQAMDIVKTRQQENNDKAIENTFDTVWQIYQNTQTQISFEELNKALKNSGMGQSISDAALVRLGIALWEDKSHALEPGKPST